MDNSKLIDIKTTSECKTPKSKDSSTKKNIVSLKNFIPIFPKQSSCNFLHMNRTSKITDINKEDQSRSVKGICLCSYERKGIFLINKNHQAKNKELQLKDIESFNNLYYMRNRKFPYKSNSGERPKKLARLIKEKQIEEPENKERTRNLKFAENNLKSKKKSNSLQKINAKNKVIVKFIKCNIDSKSRNKIPDFRTPK